ncbi:MAG: hypothetical protein ACON5H_08920 [Akkermansiaceae bacterium]
MMSLKHLLLVPALLLASPATSFSKDGEAAILEEKTFVFSSKGHLPKVGSVLKDTKVMSMKGAKMQLNIQGQIMEGRMTMKENEVNQFEILAADKIRYTVLEKESDQKMILMDQPMPIPGQPSPLLEKPVIFTKKGSTWTGALEEGDANAKEKEKIEEAAKILNADEDFKTYGDKPRKLGDEWEVDASAIMGDEDLKGKITMKFTKVEMFEGVKCAVFESQMNVSGVPEGMDGATLRMEGKLTIYRSLADKVDLSTKMEGSMSIIGKMEPQPGMVMDMKVKGPLSLVQTVDFIKAK